MKRTNNNENTNFENGIFRNDCKRGNGIDNSFEISYIEHDGLLYLDFVLPEQTRYPIGKYGSLRLVFIKEYRKGTYTTLLTQRRLNAYLYDIDITAKEQVRMLIEVSKSHVFQNAKQHYFCLGEEMWQRVNERD